MHSCEVSELEKCLNYIKFIQNYFEHRGTFLLEELAVAIISISNI